ncbi:MAG: sensor histidine kinase [Thermoleophilia bacterium]|nr:sensor histidine kinase [Thermoleophilia bacterium]
MTTRVRFALWAAVASVVAVLVAGLVAAARVDTSIDGFVDARLDAVVAAASGRGAGRACDVASAASGAADRAVSVLARSGAEECRSRPAAPSPRALGARSSDDAPVRRTRSVGGVPWRVVEARLDDGRLVVVADVVEASEQAKGDASRAILLAMVAGSIIATAIGAIAAAPATRRIDRLLERIAVAGRDPSGEARVGRVGGRDLDAAAGSFDALLDDLRSADAAQRRLFADAAHELRTPLTSIRTNAQLLERDPSLAGEARDIASRIARQGEGVARLVSGLVDFASVGAWSQRGDEPVALAPLVEHAADRARSRWPDARVEVEVDATHARVDADLVARAIGNLLDNAIVHGGADGGVATVRVELRDGVVAVEDDGAGFSEERAREAFSPFAGSHSPASAGSGLGLAFVDHVARAHGGELRIVSLAAPTRLELRLDAGADPA